MTTYDDLFESFMMNTDFNDCDVPSSDEARYVLINKAISQYNRYAKKYSGRLQEGISCNNVTEMLSAELTNDELLVITFIMAEIIANRSYSSYASMYSTYAKELGVSNYASTANHRQALMQVYREKYMSIIEDQIDTFTMAD